MAAPQWDECNGAKQNTSKSHKTHHKERTGMEGEPVHPTRQGVNLAHQQTINKIRSNKNINTAGGGRIHQQRISRGTKQITVQGTWQADQKAGGQQHFQKQ